MQDKNSHSLSTKIIFYILVSAFFILSSMFLIFENLGKNTLYDVEKEKAELIAKMFAPQIGVNLYLGLMDKVDETLKQIMNEKDILSVYLLKDGEIARKVVRHANSRDSDIVDTFKVETEIFEPGKNEQIATLQLFYSSLHYKEMVRKMTMLLIFFCISAAVLFMLLSYYIRKKLLPLKHIANILNKYDVAGKELTINIESDDEEINLIVNALEKMQKKVNEYTELQENMNQILSREVEKKTQQIWHQLNTDQLTGLANRRSLMNDLSKYKDALVAIINIDDFTEINDLYGHKAGDLILKNFAEQLSDIELELVYRVGGDEFAFIKKGKFNEDEALKLLSSVRNKIEKRYFYYDENRIDIRVTIGATIENSPTIEQADMALKEARKQHVPIKIFSSRWNLENRYRENIYWIREIKSALANDRIVPYAQPLYEISSGRIKGYELLMRLITEKNEVIVPYKFIPLAQKSHQYHSLTEVMVKKGCEYFKDKKDLTFSLNLSVKDILNKSTVNFIKESLKKYDIAHRTILELIESENIELFPEVKSFVLDMKEIGCQIAIDDFGTGYSNFSYLIKLKADYIKIDGSLIRNVHNDKNSQIVVELIVEFAKKLGIKTVAEFVSNDLIYEKVQEIGIDVAQGYYIGEPVSFSEIEKLTL